MKIRYGSSEIVLDLDETVFTHCLSSLGSQALADPGAELERAVARLAAGIRERDPEKAAVIVEDRTRSNPEWPGLLARLRSLVSPRCRLALVVAYGTHPPHTAAQHRQAYGADNVAAMGVVDHDCRDPGRLLPAGHLASGRLLLVSAAVVSADLVLTLGNVAPHVFAGFTGGPKIILPGVSDYATIRANHALVGADGVAMGRLDGNPIHEQMREAAHLVGVDLSLQVVRDGGGRICGVFAGDASQAHAEAVACCRRINTAVISELADVTWVSCGGAPKDNSLYHAQRAVTTAVGATRAGGLVVVFGRFPEGVGNALYQEWLSKPMRQLLDLSPAEIDIGIHSAYLMARNLRRCSILWYTDLDQDLARQLDLTTISGHDRLLQTLQVTGTRWGRGGRHRAACKGGGRGAQQIRSPRTCFIANGSSLLIDVEAGASSRRTAGDQETGSLSV